MRRSSPRQGWRRLWSASPARPRSSFAAARDSCACRDSARRRRSGAGACATRARRDTPAPRRGRSAHGMLAARRVGRARDTHMVGDAARLRRGRDLSAARAGVRRAARRRRQGRRRSSEPRGRSASTARCARGRRAQGDVEDGHLGRRQLSRCAPVRGGRARPRHVRSLLRWHAVRHRRDRARSARGGRARTARRVPARQSRSSRTRASTSSARAASRTRRARKSSRRFTRR